MAVSNRAMNDVEVAECNQVFADIKRRFVANRKVRNAAIRDGREGAAFNAKKVRNQIREEIRNEAERFGIAFNVAEDFVAG